jgi:hypothetical protein
MLGDAGLLHGNRGKASNNRIPAEIKTNVVKTYREQYSNFGPAFVTRKLAECEGIQISEETLRQWLIAEGLWQRKRQSNLFRIRKGRKSCFGELIWLDGRLYDWFEGRRDKCCLMNMLDDATGRNLSMLFEQETTDAAMTVLSCWLKKYGIPQALYCDHGYTFVNKRKSDIQEQQAQPRSHFEKLCDKLGIHIIAAHNPQAKEQIEQNYTVYRDYLIKKLSLAGISTIAEANIFLEETCLPALNARFSWLPICPDDGHVPLGDVDLDKIMRCGE